MSTFKFWLNNYFLRTFWLSSLVGNLLVVFRRHLQRRIGTRTRRRPGGTLWRTRRHAQAAASGPAEVLKGVSCSYPAFFPLSGSPLSVAGRRLAPHWSPDARFNRPASPSGLSSKTSMSVACSAIQLCINKFYYMFLDILLTLFRFDS
jgi:hypothetical protein